jgi:hypothetical protein
MSEKPRSRKRNIVSGNVARIEKKGNGLGLESVGHAVNVITGIIRRRKDNRNG